MLDKVDCCFDKLTKLVDKEIELRENILLLIKLDDSNSQTLIQIDYA